MLQGGVVVLLVLSLQIMGRTESVAADRKPRISTVMEPVPSPSGGR